MVFPTVSKEEFSNWTEFDFSRRCRGGKTGSFEQIGTKEMGF
jgi:hypothetical protein